MGAERATQAGAGRGYRRLVALPRRLSTTPLRVSEVTDIGQYRPLEGAVNARCRRRHRQLQSVKHGEATLVEPVGDQTIGERFRRCLRALLAVRTLLRLGLTTDRVLLGG